MSKVRNPLAGFGITIGLALGFSFFICVPNFFLPFALFGVGAFSGRSGFLGTLGFIGATMGAFLGVYAFQSLFVPQGWPLWFSDWAVLIDAAFGGCCGIGGLASGKLGLRRIERMSETGLKMRRCLKCGAKVGVAARKCWSCRAYLPPTG